MRKVASFVAVFALVLGTSNVLAAQARQGGAGVMVGLGATYTPSFDFNITITSPDFPGEELGVDVDAGPGVAARLGFAFTPAFVIFGAFEQSWHDVALVDLGVTEDSQLRHLFAGVRVNLPVAPSVAPFLSGGYGQRRLRTEEDEDGDRLEVRGNFVDLGAGIAVFIAPSLALDIGANYAFGEFDRLRIDESITINTDNVNTLRLRVGFTWIPMTGR